MFHSIMAKIHYTSFPVASTFFAPTVYFAMFGPATDFILLAILLLFFFLLGRHLPRRYNIVILILLLLQLLLIMLV